MKKNRYGQARVLDSNQLDLLIDYLPSNFHKTLATCLRRSGARVSEVCNLKWENLEKDFLLFPSTICKRKLNSREIPIELDFYNLMMNWKHEWAILKGRQPLGNDYIFFGRFEGSCINSRSFMYALESAAREANLVGTSSHSFRRSALSEASRKKIPLRVLQSLSGHRNLGTLQKYLEITDKDKREGARAFA